MEQVKLLEGRLTEAESSREKLRNIIRKLKEDRTHYRSLAEKTQYVSLKCKSIGLLNTLTSRHVCKVTLENINAKVNVS